MGTRLFLSRGMAALYASLALCCAGGPAFAEGMVPLSDASLSTVQGRDGLSFDLSNFSMSGDARFTYFAPSPSSASAYIGNVFLTRSDDPANPFADAYRMDIIRGATGTADFVNLAFPENLSGLQRWQAAFDWGVNADGVAFEGGSVVVRDAAFFGGGLQWSTPRIGEGLAFGLGLRMDIGNILLRPRGRDDITLADPAGVTEQMNISGIRIGAVDNDGNFLNTPWRIADVNAQPGIFNAVTDASGQSRLHFGIDWPDANGAPMGGMQIDKIAFRSDVTGNVDLGSSRIGSIQIQYLDVKVRP